MSIKSEENRANHSWFQSLRSNATSIRQVRFAVGVTSSAAVAYGFNWPLSFLFPIFTCLMLSMPLPRPTLRQGMNNMLSTLKGFAFGLVFSVFLVRFPILFLILLFVALFYIYYYINRGGSFWLTLMCMFALLMLPMMANAWEQLAIGFSLGFVGSSWLAVIWVWVMHYFIPDQQNVVMPSPPGFQNIYSPVAAQLALKSTLVTFPLAAFCISFSQIDLLLTMIFAAIFTLKPELTAGKEAGKNSLVSTIIGGVFAYVFYWLLVAVPEYEFFVILLFGITLFFGMNIFSDNPNAKYWGSAMTCVLVLVNGAMGEDAEFVASLINRIIMISLAILYIITMLRILNVFFFNKPKTTA
jgi:hypothetical protein